MAQGGFTAVTSMHTLLTTGVFLTLRFLFAAGEISISPTYGTKTHLKKTLIQKMPRTLPPTTTTTTEAPSTAPVLPVENDHNPTKLLFNPDSLHDLQLINLEKNEAVRYAIYEKYMPFFILTGVTFVVISIVWVIYNILSHRRTTREIAKLDRMYRKLDQERLIDAYNAVPIADLPDRSSRVLDPSLDTWRLPPRSFR